MIQRGGFQPGSSSPLSHEDAMKTVTVVREHTYAQRRRLVGQSYPAAEKDVPLLEKLGWIRPEVPRPAPQPESRPEQNAEDQADETKPEKRRRTYRRRDVEAED
jgi:hypothetical protein